jgi:hypothetical protein
MPATSPMTHRASLLLPTDDDDDELTLENSAGELTWLRN